MPPRERAIGSASVCSHLAVAEGIELVIDPPRAGLSSEAVRHKAQRRFIPSGVASTFSSFTCPISSDHGRLKETDARLIFGDRLWHLELFSLTRMVLDVSEWCAKYAVE
ncbi:hypothetical protein [Thauera sp. 63]|jgi:hypothetical protein|uniref:hypothetical protein n=1 Tax=Thauera sp. 63 TaxID=497321 RepID=UPI0002CF1CFA|nr:hypothetical protein [Thauera sp. 63]ENO79108.1 MerR family transcriptional regulator [Thauera sp. 63]